MLNRQNRIYKKREQRFQIAKARTESKQAKESAALSRIGSGWRPNSSLWQFDSLEAQGIALLMGLNIVVASLPKVDANPSDITSQHNHASEETSNVYALNNATNTDISNTTAVEIGSSYKLITNTLQAA